MLTHRWWQRYLPEAESPPFPVSTQGLAVPQHPEAAQFLQVMQYRYWGAPK